MLQLCLLARLLKFGLFFILQLAQLLRLLLANKPFGAICFVYQRSRLLKFGLLLCVAPGIVCEVAEVWAVLYFEVWTVVAVSSCGSALLAVFCF